MLQQLNLCGLAGSALGAPIDFTKVQIFLRCTAGHGPECSVYVFYVYGGN